jgi:acyl carrier protein
MSTSKERVVSIIKKHIKVEESQLLGDVNLTSDLGVDSLTLFEIILDLEKEFSCEISEKDADTLVSIDKVVQYMDTKIQEGTAH